MSAHNHDEEFIKNTVGKRLQKKADDAKDNAMVEAIMKTDIKGLSREEAAIKLKNAIDETLSK